MHYSTNPRHCRVDFWKPSGKWYATELIQFFDWTYSGKESGTLIHDAFIIAIVNTFKEPRFVGMTATCLEPYHEFSHPVSLVVDESWWKYEGY